jgi:hypothetical protein
VEFALGVEGNDRLGKPFQTKAKATKISRGGATLIIDIDGGRRIGVKLLDANGWFAE